MKQLFAIVVFCLAGLASSAQTGLTYEDTRLLDFNKETEFEVPRGKIWEISTACENVMYLRIDEKELKLKELPRGMKLPGGTRFSLESSGNYDCLLVAMIYSQ